MGLSVQIEKLLAIVRLVPIFSLIDMFREKGEGEGLDVLGGVENLELSNPILG